MVAGVTSASLAGIHEGWSAMMIVGNGMAGLWALSAIRWPSLRTRALWWFTAVTQVSVFIQVALGVGLVAGQGRPVARFHMFYGFVAIVAVGIIYSCRQSVRHRVFLLYGLGGLFVMGLGIRALLVGSG